MSSLKGTQTEKNLLIAFAGESQARNRYTFFASAAKKDGFEAIGKYSKKLPPKKKNMQNVCLNISKGANWKSPPLSQPVKSAIRLKI